MQKITLVIIFCFILFKNFGQAQRKISTYLLVQYNKTIYDFTLGNNPWGTGLGLQAIFNNKTRFKPAMEVTADIYLEDDKVLRLNPDGSFPKTDNSVRGMVNLFAGSLFQPAQNFYLSFMAGPSFVSGRVLPGIKPSVGFYFSKTKKWTGKISYINVFNRTQVPKEDFGSISFAIGLKQFQ